MAAMHHTSTKRIRMQLAWCILAFAILLGLGELAIGDPNTELMLTSFTRMWGAAAVPKFEAWRTLISSLGGAGDSEKLKKINDFFNRRIVFKESIDIWADKDYWPTPNETIGRGAGNCTAYSLAKYYSLKLAGVPNGKLRMVYVRAGSGGSSTVPPVAHMVVAYYADPDSEPIILDNLISDLRPASRRPDLSPVFSFNEDGIFDKVATTSSAPVAGSSRYSKWESFLKKATEQGFR